MIVGIDEVGMGPVAGPVVVAATLIQDGVVEGVRDSKLVGEKLRYALAEELRVKAEWFQIAQRSSDDINERGLFPCVYECIFELADTARQKYPGARIVMDGQPSQLHTKKKRPWLEFVAGGDASIYQIGAASLIAKAHRDLQMIEFAKQYPGYGFEKNKGYPVEQHVNAIFELGVTPIHRNKSVGRTMTRRALGDKKGQNREEIELTNAEARKLLNQIGGMFDVLDDWTKGFIKSLRSKVFEDDFNTPTARQGFFLTRATTRAKKRKSKKEKARLKHS